ncbi:MAG TPA: universal stress protein [Stellaceae bacterium]|jgi:nucleotide-binding universal stress UspA family protein|nr:universal stress protein [Stellaceae bacterium]
MAFKNILVQLDNHRNCESRLETAIALAQQSEGRISALYGFELPPSPKVSYAVAESYYATSDAERETYERQRDGAFDDATQFERAFYAAARRANVPAAWELWPEKPKDLIETITLRARYADIAILGQADPDHPLFHPLASLPEMVMLGCGRPVLIIPHSARVSAIGKRILIAWNGTREAARAVADAMPLLIASETVTVLTIAPENNENLAQPAHELARQLAQHGIHAEASHLTARDLDAGDLILSRVEDLACDLLVMGGYGHSRTREFILGGVTHVVLESMTVPVLMSH